MVNWEQIWGFPPSRIKTVYDTIITPQYYVLPEKNKKAAP